MINTKNFTTSLRERINAYQELQDKNKDNVHLNCMYCAIKVSLIETLKSFEESTYD